jgi:hypothetical protein
MDLHPAVGHPTAELGPGDLGQVAFVTRGDAGVLRAARLYTINWAMWCSMKLS